MDTIYQGPEFEAAVVKLLRSARARQSQKVLSGFGERQRARAAAREEAKAVRRATREARHRQRHIAALVRRVK